MAPTTRVQFSPVTPLKGVKLVESRESLKLASGVRFAHPLPLAAGAIGSASDSDSEGSRFEAWAASQSFTRASSKGQDGTLRTYKSGFDSSFPYQFSAGRPIAQDAALRALKLGLESPLVDQSSRCRPTGEALDCRSRGCGFDSRTPRQVFRGCRLTAGSLVLTQRMRVQLSPGPTTGVSSNWPGSLSFKQRMRDRDPPPLPSFGL